MLYKGITDHIYVREMNDRASVYLWGHDGELSYAPYSYLIRPLTINDLIETKILSSNYDPIKNKPVYLAIKEFLLEEINK